MKNNHDESLIDGITTIIKIMSNIFSADIDVGTTLQIDIDYTITANSVEQYLNSKFLRVLSLTLEEIFYLNS